MYGGKCYLLYETQWTTWSQASTNCQSPTTNICDGNGHPCINSATGVGRLATFENWTDYTAVTSQLSVPTSPVIVGMQCNVNPGNLSNYDPYNNCHPPASIPGNPGCTQNTGGNTYVIIGTPWNSGFIAHLSGHTATNYICEAGKIFSMLLYRVFTRSNPRIFDVRRLDFKPIFTIFI